MDKNGMLIGGSLEVLASWSLHFNGVDADHMMTPAQTRGLFEKRGLKRIVAFQTRNVPHR